MRQRGRKSAENLSLAPSSAASENVEPFYANGITRLVPSQNMTDEQRAVWFAIVNSRPPEWFGPEHAPLLEQYCRHKVIADGLAARIEGFTERQLDRADCMKRYDSWCKMLERETRTLTALARSMRLTQQSNYGPRRANTAALAAKGVRKPWSRDA